MQTLTNTAEINWNEEQAEGLASALRNAGIDADTKRVGDGLASIRIYSPNGFIAGYLADEEDFERIRAAAMERQHLRDHRVSKDDRGEPENGLALWAGNRERERLIAARLATMTSQAFAGWCAWLFYSPDGPLSSWRQRPDIREAARLFDEAGRGEPHGPLAFRGLAERISISPEAMHPDAGFAHQAALWLSDNPEAADPRILLSAVALAAGARVKSLDLPAEELEAAIRNDLRRMGAASQRFAAADDSPELLVGQNDGMAAALVARLTDVPDGDFAAWRHWAFTSRESPAHNWLDDPSVVMAAECFGQSARGEEAADFACLHETLRAARHPDPPALHSVRAAASWLAADPDREDPRFLAMAVGMLRAAAGWEAEPLEPIDQANAEKDALLAMRLQIDSGPAAEAATRGAEDDGPSP